MNYKAINLLCYINKEGCWISPFDYIGLVILPLGVIAFITGIVITAIDIKKQKLKEAQKQ